MALVATWKRMTPPDYSGILDAHAKHANIIGEAFRGAGETAQKYAENRASTETDAFVADLMQAGSQEERDNMIDLASKAWLNMDEINATNYELGQPERDLAVALAAEGRAQDTWEDQLEATQKAEALAYTKKLADDFAYSQKMEDEIYKPRAQLIAAADLAEFNAEQAALKAAASKKLYENYGDDPTEFLKDKYGFFEGGMWATLNPTGPAMGQDDLDDLDWWGGKFGSEYDRKAFNDFVVKGGIMFDDRVGGRDAFYFIDVSGNEIDLKRSYSKEKAELLYQAIVASKGGTAPDLAEQGGFFQTLNDAAKKDYPDLYAQIDNPDTPENEFLDLFATLSDTQKSSSGLSEAFLKSYIENKDNKVNLIQESIASAEIQGEAKGKITGMSVSDMELLLGKLLAIEEPSELDTETIRQLLLKTEK